MELNLQPLAHTCWVTGHPFSEGERVASYLVRDPKTPEILRYDVRESAAGEFAPTGFVACSWTHAFKPRRAGDNPYRAMKLTAENLFITLADPLAEPTEENTRLLQFLALMLERKKILRPRGRNPEQTRNVYEHAKSKQLFEVPVGELTPQFFIRVQEQLSVLVGTPKPKPEAAPVSVPADAAPET